MELGQIILVAILANIPIGLLAIRKQTLRVPDGVIAAAFVGFLLLLVHPLLWLLLLIFFGSSTFLTRFRQHERVKQEALSLAEKGGQRDGFQVFANVGVIVAMAMIHTIQTSLWSDKVTTLPMIFSMTVFAVVNADTWATELGVTSKEEPFSILNPSKRVPRGTSGGISPKGLLASLAGAAVIGSFYYLLSFLWLPVPSATIFLITLGGLLGSLIDSFLGATIQAQYYCPVCDKLTEKKQHLHCGGTLTELRRGIQWFNNDLVNFCAASLAATICLLIYFFTLL